MAEQTKEKYEDSHLYRIRHSTAHIMAEAVLGDVPRGTDRDRSADCGRVLL